ncbi:hypothetical protein AB0G74_28480 [Streptomyces sp. NPDC020875]|uniref:hypothetical protein n=1 Tax=Streptomyces sp. NPDC020875 TaxID=3154898 RepID=UPI0033D460AC
MSDLTPTPDRPGLHITAPTRNQPARASAVCPCGASATATGDAPVRALIDGYTAHHGPAHHGGAR